MTSEHELPPNITQFLNELESITWFANIGKPLPPDATVERLSRWEDWPGPQGPAVYDLYASQQALHDQLLAQAEDSRDELKALWDQVHEIVFRRAASTVPYDPLQDCYHGPTMA